MYFYLKIIKVDNKLVNMVNRNISICLFDLCFLNPAMYMLKTERYLDFYMAYIFLNAGLLQPFWKCVHLALVEK